MGGHTNRTHFGLRYTKNEVACQAQKGRRNCLDFLAFTGLPILPASTPAIKCSRLNRIPSTSGKQFSVAKKCAPRADPFDHLRPPRFTPSANRSRDGNGKEPCHGWPSYFTFHPSSPFPQHFLYFFPLPQGQGAFLPILPLRSLV